MADKIAMKIGVNVDIQRTDGKLTFRIVKCLSESDLRLILLFILIVLVTHDHEL